MKRFSILLVLIPLVLITISHLQAQSQKPPENAAPKYRVMSVSDMFKGDDAAMKKVYQMAFSASVDGKPIGRRRTDMDTPDYEAAINRLAKDGWELVTVNKSNYWVFQAC